MHEHRTSASHGAWSCTYCNLLVPNGAAVSRAGHPYHAICLVLTLPPLAAGPQRRTLRVGLLPAGKERNARRSNLYKNNSPSTEVGGHA